MANPTHYILSIVLLSPLLYGTAVAQEDKYTTKAIFTTYQDSIVRVVAIQPVGEGRRQVNFGTGFVIAGNLIITANHVVTGGSSKYFPEIVVRLSNGKGVSVVPILAAPSENSKLYDYAILRATVPIKSAALQLGTWKEVSPGDRLTTMGYMFGLLEPVLLEPMAASLLAVNGVNLVIFQGPNNKGMSGAPLISNRTGNVVGIVTSRLVGISDDLIKIRNQALNSGTVRIGQVSPLDAIVEITNVLDANLTSGMGASVAVDYAKVSLPTKQK